MKTQSFFVSMFLAFGFSAVTSLFVVKVSKNDILQDVYCKSLEPATLLPEMKDTIRRDCIGEIDRETYGKVFLVLLPFLVVIFGVFNHYYNELEKQNNSNL
jgi:hypothetical protein